MLKSAVAAGIAMDYFAEDLLCGAWAELPGVGAARVVAEEIYVALGHDDRHRCGRNGFTW